MGLRTRPRVYPLENFALRRHRSSHKDANPVALLSTTGLGGIRKKGSHLGSLNPTTNHDGALTGARLAAGKRGALESGLRVSDDSRATRKGQKNKQYYSKTYNTEEARAERQAAAILRTKLERQRRRAQKEFEASQQSNSLTATVGVGLQGDALIEAMKNPFRPPESSALPGSGQLTDGLLSMKKEMALKSGESDAAPCDKGGCFDDLGLPKTASRELSVVLSGSSRIARARAEFEARTMAKEAAKRTKQAEIQSKMKHREKTKKQRIKEKRRLAGRTASGQAKVGRFAEILLGRLSKQQVRARK